MVKSNLALLNGEIEVETQKGLGTRFTLKVPLTLIISQALFVRCGSSMFALPLAFVEEIRRLKTTDIEEVGGKLLTKVRDVVTEIVRLDNALGLEPIQPINGYFRMVIVNVAGRQVGIVVEDVVRKDEIVIKSLGEFLRNLKMFPGATIAPDGSLILLIDVNRLVAGEAIEHRPLMTSANAARIFAPGAAAVAHGAIPQEAIDFVPEEKLVVLVDDSISVRKFVGRMLEKAGYRVKLAADGLEALEIVTQTRCDLVVTDLEMPRTNGYELLSHLRQDPQTRGIPVMVVTSRAGAKHRERAIKEGAAAFLTKPVQEDQFIAAVGKLIGSPAEHADGKRGGRTVRKSGVLAQADDDSARKRIRVLVVDDSAFMRKVLQSIIAADPQLEVCGEARDGRDAVTQTEVLKPDVISMDINMPHMDGLQATEIIMSSNPAANLDCELGVEGRRGCHAEVAGTGRHRFCGQAQRRHRSGHELSERRTVPQAQDGREGPRGAYGDALQIAA